MKKNPVLITQFLKKCTIRMPFIGKKYPEHKIKDCNFGQTKSHAIIVHDPVPAGVLLRSNLSEQRSNMVRKTLNSTTRAKSHTEKQLAVRAAAATAAAAVYL